MSKVFEIYSGDLASQSNKNKNMLKMIYTVPGYSQTAVMHIPADSNTGFEILKASQTIITVSGNGLVMIDYKKGSKNYPLRPSKSIIIPAGLKYSIINPTSRPLKLVNTLSPSIYPADHVIEKLKASMPNKDMLKY